MKAMLELEMPESCIVCPLSVLDKTYKSQVTCHCIMFNFDPTPLTEDDDEWYPRERHPHCPLKTLPEGQPVTDCNQLPDPDLDTPDGLIATIKAILQATPLDRVRELEKTNEWLRGEVKRQGEAKTEAYDHCRKMQIQYDELAAENEKLKTEAQKAKGQIFDLELALNKSFRSRNWLAMQLAQRGEQPRDAIKDPDGLRSEVRAWVDAAKVAEAEDNPGCL